jgi:PDZ domain-containing protein/PEGA domain-containing protein
MPFSASSSAPPAKPRRPGRAAAAVLPLILLLSAALPLLRAQEEEDLTAGISELDVHLKKGKELFQSLKFSDAISEFNTVVEIYEGGKVQDVGADVIRKVAEALDLRARANFNQGDRDRARADFAKLLKVKIDYTIDAKMVSPKVIELFNEVKRENVGSLSVATDPPAAQAILGEEPLGRTPILGRPVMQGTYKLSLTLKGYADYQEDLIVTPHTELKKEIRLKPNARTLQFITQPANVNVVLDGQVVGTTFGTLPPEFQSMVRDAGLDPARASAPLLVPSVSPGSHVVRFEKECFEPNPRTINVSLDLERNTPQVFTPVLMKDDLGQIKIVSHPSGAEVFVDGKSQGATPLQQAAICAGEREIRLVKKDGGTWFERVRIRPGALNTLDARLRPTLLYLGTFRLDGWGRLNWSDEDKSLQEAMKGLGSVNQVRPSDALKAFRDAAIAQMTQPSEVEEIRKGRGIPPQRVVDALGQFQADLLMAVFTVETGGTAVSTAFLYSSEQPEPDRIPIDLTREQSVKAFLDRFDHVPDLQRPWIGAAFADTLLGEGATVVRVVKGGPAAAGGFVPGDQILSINNRKITSARELALPSAWKEKERVTLGVQRESALQTLSLTVGTTPELLPMSSPDILYNKALCDYRQVSRGDDEPMSRSLALLNLGIAFMHFRAFDRALTEALNLANLPAGGGVSRGTVRYYQGLCLLKKELVPEARTAFQDAAAASDATLESNDGPPVAVRARKLLK